jgi:hypothetical protein
MGYNVYYGGASGAYTNEICAGNATNVIISGLVQGTTYYFAATTYAASGMESPFSSEVSYLVPPNVPIVNQLPTLDPVNNLVLNAGDGLQRITLTGISSGTTNKTRRLRVTARASNHLISRLMVQYISPGTNGTLTFRPGRSTGTAAISVTVNNGEKRNNIITRTFTVTLMPPGTSSAVTTGATNDKGSGDPAFAAVLTPLAPASGRFAMTVAGVQGDKYVVEASTDLVHWVPVQTNTAPFTFVDAQAGQISRQFYRSVYLP